MDLQEILLQELNFLESPNLDRSPSWSGLRDIPHIDAVYSIENARIAYFGSFVEPDSEELFKLYKSIWNESEVSLLYVSFPHEIRIYNCYAEPPRTSEELNSEDRLLKHLTSIIRVEDAISTIRSNLNHFDRIHLDSETFWDTEDGLKIKREKRANEQLLHSILQVRELLNKRYNLTYEVIYDLLGRSIFIQYLEDRGLLTPEIVLQMTDFQATNYRSVLRNYDLTYTFFERLSTRFKGDIFPVRDIEKHFVTPEILAIILGFMNGTIFVGEGIEQLSFWPFDFRYIPIGFISEIYDTFIDNRRATGAYYTSQKLVDFILQETLPSETISSTIKILDPACGSGVFLVRAYQRLPDAWVRENHQGTPPFEVLAKILSNSIYGCDINESASRIAVFNLYLAMLDYVEISALSEVEFAFPKLLNINIFPLDFFSKDFEKRVYNLKFDRVLGNPPWGKTTLTRDAERVIKEKKYSIGSKQIVQVFMLYAPEFCSENGEIAFLAPAKSTIHIKSDTHRNFASMFFSNYHPRIIVNFSALVYELFSGAISPAIAIFYKRHSSGKRDKIIYCVPKPSPLFRQTDAIVIDTTEIKYLESSQVLQKFPTIWKTALWGNHRDIALISRLQSYSTLNEVAQDLDWKIGTGFQQSGKKTGEWLQQLPYLPAEKFRAYTVNVSHYEILKFTNFYRLSDRMQSLFIAPLAIVLEGVRDQQPSATFVKDSVSFKQPHIGISGKPQHESYIKWLVAYINSPLNSYYQFMTSTSWAVERGRVIQGELRQIPFRLPNEDQIKLLNSIFDDIDVLLNQQDENLNLRQSNEILEQYQKRLSELVFDVFELTRAERYLVLDTVKFTIDFFYWSKRKTRKSGEAISIQKPNEEMLQEYVKVYLESVNSLLKYQGAIFSGKIFVNSAPLCVVEFRRLFSRHDMSMEVSHSSSELHAILTKLDGLLLQRNSSIYMRRHVRIYDGNRFYLIRPSENRFWTRAQALADADESIHEWLSYTSNLSKEVI